MRHRTYAARGLTVLSAYGHFVKTAVAFFVPVASSAAVRWRWRSLDGTANSNRSFQYYCDCVEDARTNGYRIESVSQRHSTPVTGIPSGYDHPDELFFSGQAPRTLH